MAIRLEASVVAKCSPEHAWSKFQDLEQWGWWNRLIGQTRWLEGQPWRVGSRFLLEFVRPRAFTVRPVVIHSTPPNRIAWRGKGKLITGEHWFSFELQPDGTTLLKTWEDFSGLGTIFFSAKIEREITRMYTDWLAALKTEAEQIARDERARA